MQNQKYIWVLFLTLHYQWTYHVQVCKKMSYYLYFIRRHKHCLDAGLIKLLLDTLVLSHLRYALPLWGPALSQQSLHRLKHVQNWAVRMTMENVHGSLFCTCFIVYVVSEYCLLLYVITPERKTA